MGADLQYWVEWKERCALELCDDQARSALRGYADTKFAWYARKIASGNTAMSTSEIVGNAGDCWHLLETHMTLGVGNDGKSLKKWLFARVSASNDPALKVVLGGVRVIIRDVVRKYLRAELPEKNSVSIDCSIDVGGDRDIDLKQLLPSKSELRAEVEIAEMKDIADKVSAEIFEGLDFSQRIVLLAKSLPISLSDPTVAAVAGKGRSMLSRIWRSTISELGEIIENDYPAEDSDWKMELAGWTMESLNGRIFFWSRVEKRCAKLLELMGG